MTHLTRCIAWILVRLLLKKKTSQQNCRIQFFSAQDLTSDLWLLKLYPPFFCSPLIKKGCDFVCQTWLIVSHKSKSESIEEPSRHISASPTNNTGVEMTRLAYQTITHSFCLGPDFAQPKDAFVATFFCCAPYWSSLCIIKNFLLRGKIEILFPPPEIISMLQTSDFFFFSVAF